MTWTPERMRAVFERTKKRGRAFLFTVAPLRIERATGSPMNPIAML